MFRSLHHKPQLFLQHKGAHKSLTWKIRRQRWPQKALTCPNSVHVLEPAHDFVRDQVAVVPDRKILLPYKRRKRLPPLVGPAQPRVGVLPVVDLGCDVWAPQVETIFQGDASCEEQGKEESWADNRGSYAGDTQTQGLQNIGHLRKGRVLGLLSCWAFARERFVVDISESGLWEPKSFGRLLSRHRRLWRRRLDWPSKDSFPQGAGCKMAKSASLWCLRTEAVDTQSIQPHECRPLLYVGLQSKWI